VSTGWSLTWCCVDFPSLRRAEIKNIYIYIKTEKGKQNVNVYSELEHKPGEGPGLWLLSLCPAQDGGVQIVATG